MATNNINLSQSYNTPPEANQRLGEWFGSDAILVGILLFVNIILFFVFTKTRIALALMYRKKDKSSTNPDIVNMGGRQVETTNPLDFKEGLLE